MSTRVTRPATLVALAVLLTAAPTWAVGDTSNPVATLVLGPQSSLPSYPAGVGEWAYNHITDEGGGWTVGLLMDDFVEIMASESGAVLAVGQVLSTGQTVSYIDHLGATNASGHMVTELGLGGSSAVGLNDAAVVVTGDPLLVPGLPAGLTWKLPVNGNVARARRLHDNDRLDLRAQALGGPQPIDVVVRHTIDAGGALTDPELLFRSDVPIDGHDVLSLSSFDSNASGQILVEVTLDLPSGPQEALVLDGQILHLTGTPSLLPGGTWAFFSQPSLDPQGNVAFLSHVSGLPGSASLEQAMVRNDEVLALTGDAMPGLPGTAIGELRDARLADDGSTAWIARWSDPGSGSLTNRAIVVDGDVALRIEATNPQDVTPTQLGWPLSSINSWSLARDGSRLLFETGSIYPDEPWGMLELGLKPWLSLAGGLGGLFGIVPKLSASGSLQAGSTATLELTQAKANSTAHLVVGLSQLMAPFKGGLLHPHPDVIVSGLPVTLFGSATVAAPWPAGIPGGTRFWLQFWVADAAAPAGFSASHPVRGTTP